MNFIPDILPPAPLSLPTLRASLIAAERHREMCWSHMDAAAPGSAQYTIWSGAASETVERAEVLKEAARVQIQDATGMSLADLRALIEELL